MDKPKRGEIWKTGEYHSETFEIIAAPKGKSKEYKVKDIYGQTFKSVFNRDWKKVMGNPEGSPEFKEFIKKLTDLGLLHKVVEEHGYGHLNKEKTRVHCIRSEAIETGGVEGGSCWEDIIPRGYSLNHEDPDFEDLDKVLEEVCPQITYLQFKKIKKVVKTHEYTDHEYYGNKTNYLVQYIEVKIFFEKLKELGLLK